MLISNFYVFDFMKLAPALLALLIYVTIISPSCNYRLPSSTRNTNVSCRRKPLRR